MDHKAFKLSVKDIQDSGEFEGLASVYGNTDEYGDVVERGAFTKTLAEQGDSRPLLWQHYMDSPLGIASLTDTDVGLKITGKLHPAVSKANEAISLMKMGALRGLSIGFRTMKDTWDTEKGIRRLTEIKLYEVSLVTIPANPLAQVTSVKSYQDAELAIRNIKEFVEREKKAGRTLSAASRLMIEDALKALQALLEAAAPVVDEEAAGKTFEPHQHSAITEALAKSRELFQ